MVASLAQEELLQRLLQPGNHGLEEHQRDEEDRGLEYRDVESRHGLEQRVQLTDDGEIDADQERRGERVEDGLPRDQLGVEEPVAHHRVGDPRGAEDEGRHDQGRARERRPGMVEERGNRDRDRVEAGAGGQTEEDGAELGPDPGVRGSPVAQPEQRERGRDVEEIHRGEEDHVESEEELRRHAQHVHDGRADRVPGHPGDGLVEYRSLRLEKHDPQMEDVRGEDPQAREGHATHEPVLRRKHAGEVEERGKEELPEIIEGAEEIRPARELLSSRSLQDEPDRAQHGAQAAEEKHEGGGPVRFLPRRFAQDHDAEEEDEPADDQVEGGDRKAVHETFL